MQFTRVELDFGYLVDNSRYMDNEFVEPAGTTRQMGTSYVAMYHIDHQEILQFV